MKDNYLEIKKDSEGLRLDKFLLNSFKNLNFIKVQKLIRIGFFKVNNKKKNLTINSNLLMRLIFQNLLGLKNLIKAK